jgi:hypothetical protein
MNLASMKPVAKIFLIGCGVMFVLAVVAVALAARWFSANKDRLRVEADQVRAEGRTFGRASTSPGCVAAALDRYRNDRSLVGQIRTRVWLTGCLEGAPFDSAFCAGVPPREEIMRTVTWRLDQCSRHGLEGDADCAKLLTAVQEHCERAAKK